MLGDKTAFATIAVKDMDAAKKFYEDTLGLKAAGGEEGGESLHRLHAVRALLRRGDGRRRADRPSARRVDRDFLVRPPAARL